MSRVTILTIGAAAFALVALCYFGMCFRSVDYHDGAYHHIPRGRYAVTSLAAIAVAACCWRARRGKPAGRGDT